MAFYFKTSSINFLLNNLDDSEIILLRDGLKLVGDGKLCLSPITLLCFDRVMGKSYRNNNTIPHNPLRFDSGLSGTVSKKLRVQETHRLPVPFFDLVVVCYVSILV